MISCWPENPQTLLMHDTLEVLTDHLQIKTQSAVFYSSSRKRGRKITISYFGTTVA